MIKVLPLRGAMKKPQVEVQQQQQCTSIAIQSRLDVIEKMPIFIISLINLSV